MNPSARGISLVAIAIALASSSVDAGADPLPWPFPSTGFPIPSTWPTVPMIPLPPVPSMLPTPTALPPPVTGGAFVRGAPYTITAKKAAAKIIPYLKSTPYPRFAPDGKTLLLAGSTTRLVSDKNPVGVVLPDTRGYRTAFAPDSKRLVASDEDKALRIWNVPSGSLVRKIDDAFPGKGSASQGAFVKEVSFPEASTVYFHTGCRLKRLDLATGGDPVSIGLADKCGPVMVSKSGTRWLTLEEGSKSYGLGIWYTRAATLDKDTGAIKVFADSSVIGPFGDVRLSPDGNRFCFTKPDKHLACMSVGGGAVEVVSDGPIDRTVVFDETGTRLLYADDGPPNTPKGLNVVDLAGHTIRKLATVSFQANVWHFLSGGTRVVTQGYDGAVAYDLTNGWSMPIFTSGESESFAAVPGDPKRMLLGQAKGPSTDLSWVQLPE